MGKGPVDPGLKKDPFLSVLCRGSRGSEWVLCPLEGPCSLHVKGGSSLRSSKSVSGFSLGQNRPPLNKKERDRWRELGSEVGDTQIREWLGGGGEVVEIDCEKGGPSTSGVRKFPTILLGPLLVSGVPTKSTTNNPEWGWRSLEVQKVSSSTYGVGPVRSTRETSIDSVSNICRPLFLHDFFVLEVRQ